MRSAHVTIERDVPFATCGGVTLYADLYLPETSAPPPLIVWVHAGGWRFGTRRLAPDLSRCFAAGGFAMAAVDYRLTPRATFPAQIEDLKTAVRWLRSAAGRYRFDAQRIGLWGSSAGGHLSALAALTLRGVFEPEDAPYLEHSAEVQAVAVGYPPVDFLQLDADRPPAGTRSADPENLELPRPGMRSADADSFESLFLGAPIETCPERVRAANPLSYGTHGGPPFLILHGLADTTIAARQSVLLYEGLTARGIEAMLCLIEGLGHGFLHRTHLDAAPPRRMTITHFDPERGTSVERHAGPVFPLVEAFFVRALRLRGCRNGRAPAGVRK